MILPKARMQGYNCRIIWFASNMAVNLSFTATLSKHKPPVFLEETGGLWFLASEKSLYGTDRGLGLYLAAQKEPAG